MDTFINTIMDFLSMPVQGNFNLNSVEQNNIINVSSALAAIASAWYAKKTYQESVVKNVQKEKESDQKAHREMMEFLLFGSSSTKQHILPSYNNPYSVFEGQIIPPDNPQMTEPTEFALESICKHLGITGIEEYTDETPKPIDGSLLVLGGPVPNLYSRQILGIGTGSPLFKLALKKHVHLPLHFSRITSKKVGIGNRPKYQLVVNSRPYEVEGVKDYLVVTSIPNVYSTQFAFNHRLVNLAGVHGGGTRAVDLLLNSQNLNDFFKKVLDNESIKGVAGWQALVEVELDSENPGKPIKISDIAGFPIQDMDKSDFEEVNNFVLRSKPVQ